ncbi:MAG: Crp/Fnr family transcriptional regulator, partial [Oscillospiraceae bacterium]
MDKEYLIELLMNMTSKYNVSIDAEMLGKIVNMSAFRIVEKGTVIRHIGDKTLYAALVLDGMTRCYYIDDNGNDMTRGFSIEGTLCMDEGMLGYTESLCEWETLEETTLMIFSTEDMKKIISENDSLKNTYIYLLENALRYKIYRENGFLVENATERYVHFKKLYPQICSKA